MSEQEKAAGEQESLDMVERRRFEAGPSPMGEFPRVVALAQGEASHAAGAGDLRLDGEWELARGGDALARVGKPWAETVPAEVPGSIHGALLKTGKVPDPTVGRNQESVRDFSYRTWWLRRRFARPSLPGPQMLVFEGVCNKCRVWLNGVQVGAHEGQFGRFAFDISRHLREENDLIVCLDAIDQHSPPEGVNKARQNVSWRQTVVANNVYGWHYANLPSIGIWRSVKVDGAPAVRMENPFVFTRGKSEVGLIVNFAGPGNGWRGKMTGSICGENFKFDTRWFQVQVAGSGRSCQEYLIRLPQARLWWPVGLGEPNLYRLKLSFAPEGGAAPDHWEGTFGIRTITMAPLPEGRRSDKYEWTFVINGQKQFVKGAGWCSMDPLMDYRRERYERFLDMAARQHCQIVRATGSGLVETDEFYDVCDRKGIMVMQEWPTAWNSHEQQPPELLEETVRCGTLRLRNHPSLVMYGAGSDSSRPQHPVTYGMGRLAIELDGTRPFHTGEPFGGSRHDLSIYWSRKHINDALQMTADFWGEHGLASTPPAESVRRYLPDEEQEIWPPKEDGALAYHTPIFNTADDLDRQRQFVSYFTDPQTCGLDRYCTASQLAQVLALRTCIERSRSRWPNCTGVLHHKLNDNFPAISWSTVDWYGAPKLGHFAVRNAHGPLHIAVLQPSCSLRGANTRLEAWLMDDANALANRKWSTRIRLFGADLTVLQSDEQEGAGVIQAPLRLKDFAVSWTQAEQEPLFVVADLYVDGELADRAWYFYNFESKRDCLFDRPRATLSLAIEEGVAVVTNTGAVPALAVSVKRPGHAHTFTPEDGFLWIDPGEAMRIKVDAVEGLALEALNLDAEEAEEKKTTKATTTRRSKAK